MAGWNVHKELTEDQAVDLARHFLGADWYAIERAASGRFDLGRNMVGIMYTGDSWREVFRKAGVKLPSRRRFTSIGPTVMNGAESVASCRSKSMAERIAAALNVYEPDRRGS